MQKKIKEKVTELMYGVHPICELLKAKKRRLIMLYTIKPEIKAWKIIKPLLPKNIQIQYVTRDVLHKLAGTTDHQGIVGYATPFGYTKDVFDTKKYPFLLMLDSIQDPRNLGAILRSAFCTNISAVIITQKNSAPLNAAALKASAGLAEHMSIMLVPSAKSIMPTLKKKGYHLYLTVLENAQNGAEIAYQSPLCLVIGSEERGISADIKKDGMLVTLPQKHADISYNASVAAGIFLFLIATQHERI